MLSKGDDYPIHQTPDPIAFAGTERNFYDRYFFNGYSADGSLFFLFALGVYPNLNIMDAAFAVRIGDVQYNLRASRHLNMERMDIEVGPIRIEILEPLRRLRLVVADNEHQIAADLVFEGRHAPVEEVRSTRRNGPRVTMDYSRLTQLGRYSGWLHAGGQDISAEEAGVIGSRDRSWGMRAVGLRDPQEMVPAPTRQFHWYWVPAHLEDRIVHFYLNEDEQGAIWHRDLVMVHDDGRVEHLHAPTIATTEHPGTRWPREGVITAFDDAGRAYRVEIQAEKRIYLSGVGYMHPEWGHGFNKGPFAIGYDEIRADEVTDHAPPYLHTEAFARLRMETPDGRAVGGIGTFESLSMGPNPARGFTGMFDAP
ncbi:hypothetical protein Q4F19_08885 [Sphingomonas sp. BIUV-7]|uniref:Uncharacterized protein n=1 Tax=Sphingomonas natans TaxID=3063330 RepID=A0ABT8Y9I3_9SPHN|nr:hypothetical protein [Sphingomonas sp. BIUV-7]MDO6414493.1 hypothetical protein [Sphingomonas sp. BIUV-7]